MDETIVKKSFDSLRKIHHRYTIREEADEDKAVKLLHDKLHTSDKTNWTIRFLKTQSECSDTLPLQSIVDFRFVLLLTFRKSLQGLCQCKISLPTQVSMFIIRRSRLYTSVCIIHVSMSCVAYRCTDPRPFVWNVAVCCFTICTLTHSYFTVCVIQRPFGL